MRLGGLLTLWACSPEPAGLSPGNGADDLDSAEEADTGDSADTADTAGDADADGDGWSPNAGDCDDRLPHVYPGAPDYCDGLDADCDGEPIPDGSCGEPGDPTAMWRWSFEPTEARWGGFVPGLGDLDADGCGDIGVETFGDKESIGPLAGVRLAGQPPIGPFPMLAWDYAFPRWEGGSVKRAGDVDGDGIDDVWVDSYGGADMYSGALFLFKGRIGGFPNDEAVIDRVADATWTDSEALWYAGDPERAELNGDGHPDVLFALGGVDSCLGIVAGGPALGGTVEMTDLPCFAIGTATLWGEFHVLSDMDGDGLDEVGYTTQNETDDGAGVFTIVEGEDLWGGGSIPDVGHDAWFEESEPRSQTFGFGIESVEGDLDGDGLADLVFSTSSDDGEDYRLIFASGGVPDGAMNDWVYAEVSSAADRAVLLFGWIDDLDDDGRRDVLAANCVLASTKIVGGGHLDLADVHGSCLGGDGLSADVTDMTGDGYPEWVYNDYNWKLPGNEARYIRGLIIEGFPIPWDDPSKW